MSSVSHGSRSCLLLGRGFVGRALEAALRERGWAVTVLGRDAYDPLAGYKPAGPLSFDLLINANGNASRFGANRDPLFDFEASVRPVYRSLFDFSFQHYAFISTVDVYNDHSRLETTAEDIAIELTSLCPYGFHKRLAELAVMRQCPRWHILRLGQMIGRHAIKGPLFDLLQGKPLWIHPQSRLPFMVVEKVAGAVLELIERAPANEVYNVCGRGSVSLAQMLELFPKGQTVSFADTVCEEYLIQTAKAQRYLDLPDSWEEVSAFIHEMNANRTVEHTA